MKTFYLLIFLCISFFSKAQVLLDHTLYFEIEPDKVSFRDSSLSNLYSFRLGNNSQMFNKGQYENTSVGFDSMRQLDSTQVGIGPTGSRYRNTALGTASLRNIFNTQYACALGYKALSNSSMITDLSVAIGALALQKTDQSERNTAVGGSALQNLNHGDHNTAVGASAMYGDVEGGGNGSGNVVIGALANGLYNDNTGVYLGAFAGYSHSFGTSGNQLTALGAYAGNAQFEGFGIAIGTLAGSSFGRGSNISIGHRTYQKVDLNNVLGSSQKNIGLGNQVMANYDQSLHNSVAIGNQISHIRSGELIIENNPNVSNYAIYGSFSDRKVMLDAGQSEMDTYSNTFWIYGEASKNTAGDWASHSDIRLKKNIQLMNGVDHLNRLLDIKGVNYQWIDQRDTKTYTGFIAQDIQKAYPEIVEEDKRGFLMTAYNQTDAYLLEALRALSQKMKAVELKLSAFQQLDKELNAIIKMYNHDN